MKVHDAEVFASFEDKFIYCPLKGEVRVKVGSHRRPVGHLESHVTNKGYLLLRCYVGGVRKGMAAQRFAWYSATGMIPKDEIDHINRDKLDNRIENLREADRSMNTQNVGARKDSKTGIRGLWQCKTSGRWGGKRQINKVRYVKTSKDKQTVINFLKGLDDGS